MALFECVSISRANSIVDSLFISLNERLSAARRFCTARGDIPSTTATSARSAARLSRRQCVMLCLTLCENCLSIVWRVNISSSDFFTSASNRGSWLTIGVSKNLVLKIMALQAVLYCGGEPKKAFFSPSSERTACSN